MFRGISRLATSASCRPFRGSKVIPKYSRGLTLSPGQFTAVKRWGTIINIIAGAYIGGLIVCGGSLYFMYQDADARQNIPFELGFQNQVTAVKAINKDDVLKSPRYAVKHYRRLLIELAKKEDPSVQFDEESQGPERYMVPIIDPHTLVYKKSHKFSNFYIDIVLRYARALFAKGELAPACDILSRIIDNDDIFYKLGDAERLSQCCRLLSKMCPDTTDKVSYLQRSVDMLRATFPGIQLGPQYTLEQGSLFTDETVNCLSRLAFTMARASTQAKEKDELLNQSLSIYLSLLRSLSEANNYLESGTRTQASYPLFNCDPLNLRMTMAEIKAQISEIMWAKGYKKNAVSWGEDAVESIFQDQGSTARAGPILVNTLSNLQKMYDRMGDIKQRNHCQKLKDQLVVYEGEEVSWYDSVIARFSKIIYRSGPLAIIEKSLSERFGSPKRVLELEEFEDEDVE
ncbi:hypothetical protein JA9_004023 [Meyerozyma sp. JA9]|nr:hypothetical protein JA9_004023 [Meyerozyma sp. JA9]